LTDPSNVNAVDKVILELSSWVQEFGVSAADSVGSVIQEYFFLVDVGRENERLRLDNARYREENRQLRLLGHENERLRQLLELRTRLGGESVSAQVIGKDTSEYFRVVRLVVDRGERDRVRVGMPVVSAEGLVGQVSRLTGHRADVRLTVDRQSAVDIIIPRTGTRGMLRGTGERGRYAARIEYLERTDEIREGDDVYTSGLGQRFPSSILVGRVTRVRRREFGLYQQAEVTPSVNFSALEEVLILTSGSREQNADERSADIPELDLEALP
jgi:rod shape-determining protein MreC